MGYCSFCGKSNPNGSKYCNHCGHVMFKTEETTDHDSFTVTLYTIGKNKIRVVETLQKWFNCSLKEAYDKVEHLPIILQNNCDKETALSIVKEWQRTGAGVRESVEGEIKFDEENEVPVKKSNYSQSKISKKQILKISSSCLFIIGLILILFLPLFFNKELGKDGTEKVYTSLFNLVYIYTTGIISGKIQLFPLNLGLFYIAVVATTFILWCTTIIKAIKTFIGDIKNAKINNDPSFFNKIGLNHLISIGADILATYFIMRFDGLVVVSAISIAVTCVVAAILEKIAYK